MGLLELGAWERQVWGVVLARAESRCASCPGASGIELIGVRSSRGQIEMASHIKRLSPLTPSHWTSEPGADADPGAEELMLKGTRLLVTHLPRV